MCIIGNECTYMFIHIMIGRAKLCQLVFDTTVNGIYHDVTLIVLIIMTMYVDVTRLSIILMFGCNAAPVMKSNYSA